MAVELARWRATYIPGDWIVLSGPTSLVVLQPLGDDWSEWVGTIWEAVLASATMVELAEKMTALGLEEMPSFGAFFWSEDGMRSLVRGGVRVRDLDAGAQIADGQGIQTWTEVGLGATRRIAIDTRSARTDGGMRLPLVVGAVRASAVVLDARTAVLVSSPQAHEQAADEAPPAPRERGTGTNSSVPSAAAAPGPDDLWPEASDLDDLPDTEDMTPLELMETGPTEVMTLPPGLARREPTATLQAPPPVARVVLSDGQEQDLTGPLRIGRAPSAPPGAQIALVTVQSPNQDISRSHLELAPDGETVVATDLRSTNGTILIRPGAGNERERLRPGEGTEVPVGSLLELGDGVLVRIELGEDTHA